MVEYRFRSRGVLIAIAVLALLAAVVAVADLVAGRHVVGLVVLVVLAWVFYIVFSTYYEARLEPDGALKFRSLFRETETSVRLLTRITAYRGGNDRYQFFKIRDQRGTFRIRGKGAGAFVDEILAMAPDVPIERKLLRGA